MSVQFLFGLVYLYRMAAGYNLGSESRKVVNAINTVS